MNTDDYEGHTPGPWVDTPLGKGRPLGNIERVSTTPDDGHLNLIARSAAEFDSEVEPNAKLIAAAPDLLQALIDERAEVKRLDEIETRHHLLWHAIRQAEAMRAKVGDNTWHYAIEVWLDADCWDWGYDEVGNDEAEAEIIALIERYITTNRDAWVKHWGEPSEVARKRCEVEW